MLDEIFRQRTLVEWREALRAAPFRWAPVQNAAEVVADPQVRSAGVLVDVPLKSGDGAYVGIAMPVGFSRDGRAEGAPKGQAPDVGEHTDKILSDLGYGADAIAKLRAEGAIA
jgi:crotonobetainyl-CoA:carnitine CoA-transferase CaiB-like acyl-CoA transferase